MRETIISLFIPMLPLISAGAFLWLWSANKARVENLILAIAFSLNALGMTLALVGSEIFGRDLIGILLVIFALSASGYASGILRKAGVDPPLSLFLIVAVIGSLCATAVRVGGSTVQNELVVANATLGLIIALAAQLFYQAKSRSIPDTIVFWIMTIIAAQSFIRPSLAFVFSGGVFNDATTDVFFHIIIFALTGLIGLILSIALFVSAYQEYGRDIAKAASVDGLTGLLTRRSFEKEIQDMLAREQRSGISFGLIVCDLDNFKQINDTCGHQVGDSVIESFAKLMSSSVRSGDICGRIGGEEFCIFVKSSHEEAALGLANRLRACFSKQQVANITSDIALSSSFGVATMRSGESYASLFSRADEALYKAKSTGKNKVCSAGLGVVVKLKTDEKQEKSKGDNELFLSKA